MDQGTGYEYEQFPAEPRPSGNPLGVVGFVLAFCLPPIGFLVSLLAMFKSPRGFAIAGLVISLLTSSILGAFIGGAYYMWPAIGQISEVIRDTSTIVSAIDKYERNNNGALPPDLAALGLDNATLTDPWGTPYKYEVGADGKSWTLQIAGPDGGFDDKDTATITSGMQPDEIGNTVGERLGESIFRRALEKK